MIVFQAIMCAIFFHLFLAFGFAYKEDKEPVQAGTPVANYMINLSDSSSGTTRLKAWLQYNDPSLFIKPSRKFGFSSVSHNLRMSRLPGDMKTSTPKPYDAKLNAGPGIKPTIIRPPGSLAGYVLTAPPSTQTKRLSNPSRFPALLDEKNKVLLYPKGKIALSVDPPLNQTSLKIYAVSDKLFSRVVLVRSCGNSDLDRIAIKTVLQSCISGEIPVTRDRDVTFAWGGSTSGGT